MVQIKPYCNNPEDVINRFKVFSNDVVRGPVFIHPFIKREKALEIIECLPKKYEKEESYIRTCGITNEFKKSIPEGYFKAEYGALQYCAVERLSSEPSREVNFESYLRPPLNVSASNLRLGEPYLEFIPYTINSFNYGNDFDVTSRYNHKSYSTPRARLELDGFNKPNYRGIVEGDSVAMAIQIATSKDLPLEARLSNSLDKSEYPGCVVRMSEQAQKNWIYFPNWVVPFTNTLTFRSEPKLYRGGSGLQNKQFEGEVEVRGAYILDSFFGKLLEKEVNNAHITKNIEEKLIGSPMSTFYGPRNGTSYSSGTSSYDAPKSKWDLMEGPLVISFMGPVMGAIFATNPGATLAERFIPAGVLWGISGFCWWLIYITAKSGT